MPYFVAEFGGDAGKPHVVGDRTEMWVAVAILAELYPSVVANGAAGGISFVKGNATTLGDQIANLGLSNIALVEFIDFLYGDQTGNAIQFIDPIMPRWEPDASRVILYNTHLALPMDITDDSATGVTVGADADRTPRLTSGAAANEGYSPAFPALPFDEVLNVTQMGGWAFRLKLTGYPRGS